SRPRRKHYSRRPDPMADIATRNLIIANNAHRRPELADILHEIIGKRIVIVDKKQHLNPRYTFTIFRYFFIIVTSEITEELMPKFPVLAAIVLFAGFACFSQQATTTANNAADPPKTVEQEQAEKAFHEN